MWWAVWLCAAQQVAATLDDPRQKDYVKDGWNLPGDTFVMDADGYFSYQARNDDMIISAGYNIAGPEVEGALMQHPAVAECGVVGAADPERGQVVMAFVVLKTGLRRYTRLRKRNSRVCEAKHCTLQIPTACCVFVKACRAPKRVNYSASNYGSKRLLSIQRNKDLRHVTRNFESSSA